MISTFPLANNLIIWSRRQAENDDWANAIINTKPSHLVSLLPSVVVGAMACGPSVQQDMDKLMKQLKKFKRKTVALEMESYAIFQATSGNKFDKCVIKSVCDFGDEKKDDSFHQYAAQASAALLLHMIIDLYEADFDSY